MTTIDALDVLEVETCPTCFVLYAVPREMLRRKQEQGGNWHCPNGHSVVYTKSEVAKLRESLQFAQREAIAERERRRVAEAEAETAKTTAKRETTRRRNVEQRAANGVCAFCHRPFANVARHVASQHPSKAHHAAGALP